MTPSSFIDFHTHHPSREVETVILDGRDTWGIHPWTLAVPDRTPLPSDVAIGECGLDRLCSTSYEEQVEAFRRCITESERLQKPLFLHCVRAVDDCLRLRSELGARQPWVWHGYRGSPEQLNQLLSHGFLFSFGFRFNRQSLMACPADHLLLETDEDPRPVSVLYEQMAAIREVSVQELIRQMQQNFLRIFGR